MIAFLHVICPLKVPSNLCNIPINTTKSYHERIPSRSTVKKPLVIFRVWSLLILLLQLLLLSVHLKKILEINRLCSIATVMSSLVVVMVVWKPLHTIWIRKHSNRMRIDRTATSDRVANKDEQWPSRHEADCGQNDRRLCKHYLPFR